VTRNKIRTAGGSQKIEQDSRITRRLFVGAALSSALTVWPRDGNSGPLDSLRLDPSAKVLRQGSIVVPGRNPGGTAGSAGSDLFSPARAWLKIDFALEDKAELTLMVLTQQQKISLSRGQPLIGDPLARVPIEGPETASHTMTVDQGNYFIAFLNDETRNIRIVYRASIRAF
jgi:hypothetical protein